MSWDAVPSGPWGRATLVRYDQAITALEAAAVDYELGIALRQRAQLRERIGAWTRRAQTRRRRSATAPRTREPASSQGHPLVHTKTKHKLSHTPTVK